MTERDYRQLARRYWWVGLAIPFTALFAAGFYFSLSWQLPGVLVAFGSFLMYLLGFGLFVGLPFMVSENSPESIRFRVFHFYKWLFLKAIGKAQLIDRDHAGVDLCASKFDSEKGGERVKLNGEWRDFEDTADRMHYADSAFGIGLEGSTLIFDPVDAALGAQRKRIVDAGEEVIDFGRQFGECVIEHATLPEKPPAVDLSDVKYLLGGSAEPTQAEATEDFEENAWAGYQSVPVLDLFAMVGLFAAILFVIWLAFSFASSGDGGGGGGGDSSGVPGGDIVSGFLLPVATMEWRYRR